MSILREIVENKQLEVAASASRLPIDRMKALSTRAAAPRAFAATIFRSKPPAIIAEIKRASPSKGLIRADLDALEAAMHFATNGAMALSVLTDEKYFQGRLDYVSEIRRSIPDTPVLRKDFIIDPYQVWETRAREADGILLIIAVFDDQIMPRALLPTLYQLALEARLDVLLEVHNKEELEVALSLFGSALENLPQERVLLGINNRDLNTFQTDLKTSEELIPLVPEEVLERLAIVAESGINGAADLKRLHDAGAQGYLIGEHLVAEGLVGQNLSRLIRESKKLIGKKE